MEYWDNKTKICSAAWLIIVMIPDLFISQMSPSGYPGMAVTR